ncbi:putative serine/threonine protein kinase [Blattamonas nauphoetae]|uniref:Serine/threonine protein kinase n=1 Tax=Blattamonas nauphoetae TaxID=2049346 RepID=A0ABQ9YDX4_9EUKA|nr:putative serine/threonine protein kinase [Blattamonas nauphoetae]
MTSHADPSMLPTRSVSTLCVYLVKFQGGLAAVKIIAPLHNIDGEQKYAIHFFEQGIRNPFYIRIRNTTELNHQFILMMDYANLPTLICLVNERIPPLPERVAGIIIRQILISLAEFNEHGYIHRDLKLENVFLHFDGDDSVLAQISDYGILIPESEASTSKDLVGTPVYFAPELVYLSPRFSHKSDVWAVGVMLVNLLCRCYPFQGASTQQLYTSIQTKPHTITRRDLSQHCTEAINALLSKAPEQRPTAKEALEFPFFKQFEEEAKCGLTWTEFATVTSGMFPKPPKEIYYIPDTHKTELNYRNLTQFRKKPQVNPTPQISRHPPIVPRTNFSPPRQNISHPQHPYPLSLSAPMPNSNQPPPILNASLQTHPYPQFVQKPLPPTNYSPQTPPKQDSSVPLPQLVQPFLGPVSKAESRLNLVGLVNPGLQCYLNTVIQSLFHVPLFRHILLELPKLATPQFNFNRPPSPSDTLAMGMHRLFQLMFDSLTPVKTDLLTQTIQFPGFDVKSMNDNQDFRNRLLVGLSKELKNTSTRGFLSSLFCGRLVRVVKTEKNGKVSTQVHPEHFWSLRMPIELGSGIEEVLPQLLLPDSLGTKVKYYSLPPVLFVDLVRWKSDLHGLAKNNKKFTFPTSLDLSQLIEPLTLSEKFNGIQKKKEIKKARAGSVPSTQTSEKPSQSATLSSFLSFNQPRRQSQQLVWSSELLGFGEKEKEEQWLEKQKNHEYYKQSFIYRLVAVEVHRGTLQFGHYFTYVRPLKQDKWFLCDDSKISEVDEAEAVSGQFGGIVGGREVVQSAMSLLYIQTDFEAKIGMQNLNAEATAKKNDEEEVGKLQRRIKELEESLKEKDKDIERLKSAAEEKDERSRQELDSHKKREEDLSNVKAELATLREESTAQSEALKQKEEEIKHLEDEGKKNETEKAELNRKVGRLEETGERMSQEKAALEAKIRRLEEEGKKQNSEKAELEATVSRLKEAVKKHKEDEAHSDSMIETLSEERKSEESKKGDLEREISRLTEEGEKKESEKAELEATVSRLEGALKELEREKAESALMFVKLSEEREKEGSEKGVLEREILHLTEEGKKKESEKAELEATVSRLEGALKDLEREKETEMDGEEKKQNSEKIENSLQNALMEREQRDNKIKELLEENENTQKELRELEEGKHKLELQNSTFAAENLRLKSNLASLATNLTDEEKMQNDLKEQLTQAEQMITQLLVDNQTLKKENDSHKNTVERLTDQLRAEGTRHTQKEKEMDKQVKALEKRLCQSERAFSTEKQKHTESKRTQQEQAEELVRLQEEVEKNQKQIVDLQKRLAESENRPPAVQEFHIVDPNDHPRLVSVFDDGFRIRTKKGQTEDDIRRIIKGLQAENTQLTTARIELEAERVDLLANVDEMMIAIRQRDQEINRLNVRLTQATYQPETQSFPESPQRFMKSSSPITLNPYPTTTPPSNPNSCSSPLSTPAVTRMASKLNPSRSNDHSQNWTHDTIPKQQPFNKMAGSFQQQGTRYVSRQ